MPRRLFLALLLLVATPMALLAWMSARAVKENQAAAKQSLANLLSSQLYDADRLISQQFDRYATKLADQLDADEPVFETLRRLRRQTPIVRQGIVIDSDGYMIFPPPDDSVDIDARSVAAALPGLIDARPPLNQTPDPTPAEPKIAKGKTSVVSAGKGKPISHQAVQSASPAGKASRGEAAGTANVNFAWQQWYLADGAQVVYWQAIEDGRSIGILLERSRWMADLIAVLPGNQPDAGSSNSSMSRYGSFDSIGSYSTPIGSVSLVDEANRAIFRWGKNDEFDLPPLTSIPVSAPLASWQLQLHLNPAVIPPANSNAMYWSLGAIALLLSSVGFYVLTSVQRQISQAKSRVTFAGQVSHELRTPLTNIRLYTELAESDLQRVESSDAKQSLAKRLEVIDHESRRLQRLVSGVLEMIRPSGKRIGVRKQLTNVCELVDGIVDQFRPSFNAANLEMDTRCEMQSQVILDPDIVEIVLVNLISNVEKYVPSGGRCLIECQIQREAQPGADWLTILVSDDGPGIKAVHRNKVFRPFQRIDDSIKAPSGTGIGLSIARRAARRHDGDLVLLPESKIGGATFQLTLPIESSVSP